MSEREFEGITACLEPVRIVTVTAGGWRFFAVIAFTSKWLAMNAAVAWLMADDLPGAVQPLASLSAEQEGQLPLDASQILGELVKAFPELEAAAKKAAGEARKPSGQEFEIAGDKE